MKIAPPTKPGHYWVRFEYPRDWMISKWDGERWTNIGHEAEWTPEESSIVEWKWPPLDPPGAFSGGKPFTVPTDDQPIAIVMDHGTGEVRDVLPELRLREAVRFLWNAWAEAGGQPEIAVFGPGVDGADEDAMRENGLPVRKAPPEIQNVIRNVLALPR